MKKGFTLAEVLITLGIIGIVAALTMPALMSKYRKMVVETRLQKFYSVINQAVTLSENYNGDKKNWERTDTLDIEKWYDKYLNPYIKTVKKEKLSSGALLAVFADGSAVTTSDAAHWNFYPSAKDLYRNKNKEEDYTTLGQDHFMFMFAPYAVSEPDFCENPHFMHYNKGIEPYAFWNERHWDEDKGCAQIDVPSEAEELLKLYKTNSQYGCYEGVQKGVYCTALIRANGWKIPDDYPFSFN